MKDYADNCNREKEEGTQPQNNVFFRNNEKQCFDVFNISENTKFSFKICYRKWRGKYLIYILLCLLVERKERKKESKLVLSLLLQVS